jgi:very-short-patch-repair endonuclease
MYGSSVLVRYGPYIRKLEHEQGLSARDAENRVREALGIAKIGEGWISETQLYRLVAHLFSRHEVVREASPQWLGRQRLDIYLPRLAVAIEYQGQQHYAAVDLFGGEEALQRTRERDRKKRDLCEKNGVTLVYFRHDEPLTEKTVLRKLKRFLEKETNASESR